MNTAREQYIVDTRGRRQGVILPFSQYRRMIDDLHDLAVVAERRKEKAIDIEEMKRRLKAHGLL